LVVKHAKKDISWILHGKNVLSVSPLYAAGWLYYLVKKKIRYIRFIQGKLKLVPALTVKLEYYWIRYLVSSATGTYLNNIQISNHDVIDGDIIKLGDVEFIIKCL
jgi:hypothetical protein